MIILPGQSVTVKIPMSIGNGENGMSGFVCKDISREAFGKYQYCTMGKDGLWYSDEDFDMNGLKKHSLPSPHQDTKEKTELSRRMHEKAKQKSESEKARANRPSLWKRIWGIG